MNPDDRKPELSRFRPRQRAKAPPCSCGCPNTADVRGWIGVIAQRGKTGLSLDDAYVVAWQKITELNPLPATLGRICPHPCQRGCSRGLEDGPVEIRALERFLGDKGLEMGLSLPVLDPAPIRASIGVIGAGPAGLSCAYQLARRGHHVTVYERAPRPGGMLRYGIPDYRLPPEILDGEIERILDLGIELRPNTALGQEISLEEIRRRHDAFFLGIGAQRGRLLGIPGEEGPGVWTGADYLRRVNDGEDVETGGRVVIVGGGNTAVDAARTVRRRGADVVVLYRRTRTEMPAFEEEVDALLAEGASIEFLAAPTAIERTGERVTGILARRMELGPPNGGGRRRPEPIDGSEYRIAADGVIVAVSQRPNWHRIEEIQPGGGWVEADEDGALGPALWVGGDVRGPGFASLAVSHGRLAAEAIHGRFGGETETDVAIAVPDFEPASIKADFYAPRQPVEPPSLAPADALAEPGAEVVATLDEDAFLREVERCYSCGLCFGCQQCWMYCTSGGLTRVATPTPGAYFTLTLDACEACGQCVDVCPCGYLEFERTASARSTSTS